LAFAKTLKDMLTLFFQIIDILSFFIIVSFLAHIDNDLTVMKLNTMDNNNMLKKEYIWLIFD